MSSIYEFLFLFLIVTVLSVAPTAKLPQNCAIPYNKKYCFMI